MKEKIFISYHFADKTYKGEVVKWLYEAGYQDISTDEKDLRAEGDKQIESKIREQICSSAAVLILVGNDTHNRPWIKYEIAVARGKRIPTYWVRLSNRTGAAPPEVKGIEGINYEKQEILRVLYSKNTSG